MKNWLKLNNIFFIPNPEVQKLFDSALIYNFLHLQCCSCKHQILRGIKYLYFTLHWLERLLHCSTCTVKFVSSQWTTFTSHITIIGKLFGLLILPEDCSPQRFDCLKLHSSPTAFDFYLPHSGEVFSDSTPVTPAEVSQLLQSMSSKSSPLDYIPISLLKSCKHLPTDTFSILISYLANLPFTQATFPSKFKLLSELHWLPVCHRINFKIPTITFKVLQFQQPSYLAALIPRYVPTRSLLLHCHYVFLIEKPEWHSPDHLHLLPQVFGINSQVIFHSFPLFPLSGRDSSTIFFECLSQYSLTIHWHHVLWCQPIHRCDSGQTHPTAWLTRSSWAPTISWYSLRKVDYIVAHVWILCYLLTYLLISPLLKKPGLPKSDLSNFRLI